MKDKILVFLFLGFIYTMGFIFFISSDKDISYVERRKLSQVPEYSYDKLLDTSYMDELDEYFVDHFPFRDEFRSIKSYFNFNIFNKLDNDGVFVDKGYIFKSEFTNKDSIGNFINKTNDIINKLDNDNIYVGVIPDKNYYNNSDLFLNVDYDYIIDEVDNNIDAKFIDLRDSLELDDFYKTDTHFRQDKLDRVIDMLSMEMGLSNSFRYNKKIIDDFYGVYYSQLGLNFDSESIIYLENDTINNSVVKYLGSDEDSVYTLDKTTFDKYEIFLNGAQPFIEIVNEGNKFDKELVIFRDSFSSSLAPLLLESYKKITLIDTRYIASEHYNELIDFSNQDILFLYSTLVINNSSTLKD